LSDTPGCKGSLHVTSLSLHGFYTVTFDDFYTGNRTTRGTQFAPSSVVGLTFATSVVRGSFPLSPGMALAAFVGLIVLLYARLLKRGRKGRVRHV
jgi:hypothetical protein